MHIEIVRAAPVTASDNEWVVLVNGDQHGGPFDYVLGCGTATYAGKRAAIEKVRAEFGRDPDEVEPD